MKPQKKKDLRRYRGSRNRTNYHKVDRQRNKIKDTDALPVTERMRGPIWRGQNCHGDETSFGNWYSGNIDDMILHRIVRRFNGRLYNKLTEWVAENMAGKDRAVMEDFLVHEFHDHARFGVRGMEIEYEITDAGLVKWNPRKRHHRTKPEQIRFVVPITETECYVIHWHDQKWYRCERAPASEFVETKTLSDGSTWTGHGVDAFGSKVNDYGSSYLSGYKAGTEFNVTCVVVGDARYNRLWVLRKHPVNGTDIKAIELYLKRFPL